jgi:hypothetical protein
MAAKTAAAAKTAEAAKTAAAINRTPRARTLCAARNPGWRAILAVQSSVEDMLDLVEEFGKIFLD